MLTDSYLRKHDYLRVSITDKCNLRCAYCMPPEGIPFLAHEEVLRNEEFVRLIRIFVEMGISKIRFTGGEPLIRKGLMNIIEEIRLRFPHVELAITTNGILLDEFLDDLHRLRVQKLNISLDTLSPARFLEVTRRDELPVVLANIDRALDRKFFDIKLNAVLFEETLEELEDLLVYAGERDIVFRFIERMPFSDSDLAESFISSDLLVEKISRMGVMTRNNVRDTAVSNRYDLRMDSGLLVKIGVIPSITHKFCASCNRLRLTADGSLKTCLHSAVEHDLKKALRSGNGDEDLKALIMGAVKDKQSSHKLDCYSADGGCAAVVNSRTMSKIGG